MHQNHFFYACLNSRSCGNNFNHLRMSSLIDKVSRLRLITKQNGGVLGSLRMLFRYPLVF